MDSVGVVVLLADPIIVVCEGNGSESTHLHNLLDCSAILFLLIVRNLLCTHVLEKFKNVHDKFWFIFYCMQKFLSEFLIVKALSARLSF